MATVEIIREEPKTPPVKEVVLRMSETEAKNLQQLLYNGQWPHFDAERASGLRVIHSALQRAR